MSADEMEKYRDKDRQEEAGTCIMGEMRKDREDMDITSLVEQHAKEIWALKEELSKASEELTVLRGTKQVVISLSNELVKMKKRAQEAEGENIIVKGIGNTSPEMRSLQARVKELDIALANALEVDEAHQKLNGKMQMRITELEQENLELHAENKKISHQTENRVNQLRKSGL